MNTYQLLDSGDGQKWERFGEFILKRPCPQAVWKPKGAIAADGSFSREGENKWTFRRKLPPFWNIEVEGVTMKVAPTDFGHLGVFPEHASLWGWMRKRLSKGSNVLNLFAYSGGATIAAAQAGASVCHLDASKGMIQWAKENSLLNGLGSAPIRWIADDAMKFLKREVKRGIRYDGIILDPPTFGRGSKGEVFKIERDIEPLLETCRLLAPRFLLFSCHTPGFTPTVLSHLLNQIFPAQIETAEMLLESAGTLSIPSGSVARVSLT